MRKRASVFPMIGAVLALMALLAVDALASDGGDPQQPARQEGEDRWVPSLAIIAGATIQQQLGSANSYSYVYLDPDNPTLEPLQGFVEGDDLAVAPFVGASLELMTPALPIPTRPRLFLSGEILPTFSSERRIAVDGDPDCFRGPEPEIPCARDEPYPARKIRFGETDANGEGTVTTAWLDDLVFGASLGVAFPLRIGERQLRIKPSARWIQYEVQAEGLVVDGSCNPKAVCTKWYSGPSNLVRYGYFRERTLRASGSETFNGIGPGLDIELDTFRFGPIGSSLFLGGGAYRVLGDRAFSFDTTVSFPAQDSDPGDPLVRQVFAAEDAHAEFGVEVDPWIYRAHVGIRFQWLGSRK